MLSCEEADLVTHALGVIAGVMMGRHVCTAML